LGGIDKNGRDDDICPFSGQLNERYVTSMKRTHGGHKSNAGATLAAFEHPRLGLLNGLKYCNFQWILKKSKAPNIKVWKIHQRFISIFAKN
jgi:hypothetical protein